MSTSPKLRLSEQDYLRRERAAEFRSEFYRGEMFAMAGASRQHNLLSAALVRLIGNALAGRRYEVYAHDMRVKVSATGLYTYPDVVVACGGPRFEDDAEDTLLNPTVLIEVLSDSTEKYDRGAKSAQYRQIASLQEHVLVSQAEPRVEVYRRQPDGDWLLIERARLADDMELNSIDVCIPLAEIYAQIEFDRPPEVPG